MTAALDVIRDRGPIGERSLAEAIAHADRFVALVPADATSLVDLGSGGGLPGLVIAVRRPQLLVTLVERRRSRADLLRRAVISLDLPLCEVRDVDASVVAAEIGLGRNHADVVTARSFASPPITARWAAKIVRPGGIVLVSAPPAGDDERWTSSLLDAWGLVDDGLHRGIRRLIRTT